jgi:HD-GYP domain-containing protein (c-di-GMP phosphodiesterase class II)
MLNFRGETIGVIQLLNKKFDPELVLGDPQTCIEHISPFTADDERMAMSIASQASIAVQNAQLVKDIQNLFNGFIRASVKAIESRDPTTGGHSERVAHLTVALAEKVSQSDLPKYRDIHFSDSDLQELRYASLLHDFGKIGVRENVLIKAKKLYPAERQQLLDRFHLIKRTTEVEELRAQVEQVLKLPPGEASGHLGMSREALNQRLKELEDYLDFIMKCNEPTVLAQGGFEQLHEIATKAFNGIDGMPTPFLTEKELISLSVPKGSLNDNDRKEIESHVTHTYKFLNEIPWTKDLRRVPLIAYAHHEKLDGTGYPNKLKSEQIPLQSKMMTISDIFDALTAWDRPYKKAVPIERALNILVEEGNTGHIDRDLLDVFIKGELFKLVEQKDHP